MSPLPFVANLHSSDGISVSRFDIINDNCKRSSLYAIIYVEGKIRLAFWFGHFAQSSYHDDCRNVFCPDHLPEICYRVS